MASASKGLSVSQRSASGPDAFGLSAFQCSPVRNSRSAVKGTRRAAIAPSRAKTSHGRPAENPSAVTKIGARTAPCRPSGEWSR
jgi:hypothetical protein